jgi:putative transposase
MVSWHADAAASLTPQATRRRRGGRKGALEFLSAVERLIGSIRREVLNHVVILNAPHLQRLFTDYFASYHHFRTHLALAMDCPVPRFIEPPECGEVIAIAEVGGLHHHYERWAA